MIAIFNYLPIGHSKALFIIQRTTNEHDIWKIHSYTKYNSSKSSPSMHRKGMSHKIFTALAEIYIFFAQ
jgi:hypothetical protein